MKRYPEVFELQPTTDSRLSFYGKAQVLVEETGKRTLFSYGTKIMIKEPDGSFKRTYDDWTSTTGRHIKAFSGLNKKEFMALPLI